MLFSNTTGCFPPPKSNLLPSPSTSSSAPPPPPLCIDLDDIRRRPTWESLRRRSRRRRPSTRTTPSSRSAPSSSKVRHEGCFLCYNDEYESSYDTPRTLTYSCYRTLRKLKVPLQSPPVTRARRSLGTLVVSRRPYRASNSLSLSLSLSAPGSSDVVLLTPSALSSSQRRVSPTLCDQNLSAS